MYLFVYDDPKENVCIKGCATRSRKLPSAFGQGACPRDPWGRALVQYPGTTWIKMTPEDAHEQVTVLKLEFDEELEMYGGSGAVVTHN